MEFRNCLTGLVAGGLMLLTAGCSIGSPTLRSASMRRTEVGPIVAAAELIPETAYRELESAKRVLARISADRDSLTEEDLMAFMIPLIMGEAYWMNRDYGDVKDGVATQTALIRAIRHHPHWTGRSEPLLKALAQAVCNKDTYRDRTVLAEAFGVKHQTGEEIWGEDYPLDGTWTDWLKPGALRWDDRLNWAERTGSSAADRIGWFKTAPDEKLPFKGRILCLLKKHKRVYSTQTHVSQGFDLYSMIFTFETEADLEAAIVTLSGGLDKRLYGGVPNFVLIPGATMPPCAWLDYRDADNGCYLLSVSATWTLDSSSWFFLPDSITPPGRKKETRK